MLEQVSSSTESAARAEAKGKTGNQGVFANLFKALAHKGAVGKFGATALAAQLSASHSRAGMKTGDEAETLKGVLKGGDGKTIVLNGLKTGVKEIRFQGDSGEEAKQAGLAAVRGKQAGADTPMISEEEKLAAALRTAGEGKDKGEALRKGEAGKADETKANTPEAHTESRKHRIHHADSKTAPHTGRAALETHSATQKATLVRPADDSREEHPDIGLAHARTAVSEQVSTAGRAADKPAVRTTRHGDAQAGMTHAGEENAQAIRNTDKGKDRSFTRAGASTGNEHEAANRTGRPATQAGALDIETLQHDTDAVQRIREELAAMANKIAGRTGRAGQAQARDNDGKQGVRQLIVQHGQTTQSGPAQPAQPVVAPQATGMQTAQAVAASVAAESGQHSGHDAASGRDSGDSRMAGSVQADVRPQQTFDLQQQAAARMAQPMRALEAMQSIAKSAANGTSKLEIQLEPAHLGKVHISLQTDAAKQLQMHLTVESHMTRQVIEQHMPQLRAALELHGLNLDNFSLNTGSQGRQQEQAGEFASSTLSTQQNPLHDADNDHAAPRTASDADSRLSIHV